MTLDCFFDNFTLKDKESNWDYKTDLFKDLEGTKTEWPLI